MTWQTLKIEELPAITRTSEGYENFKKDALKATFNVVNNIPYTRDKAGKATSEVSSQNVKIWATKFNAESKDAKIFYVIRKGIVYLKKLTPEQYKTDMKSRIALGKKIKLSKAKGKAKATVTETPVTETPKAEVTALVAQPTPTPTQ